MQEASAAGGGELPGMPTPAALWQATTMLIFSREVKSRLVLNREGKIQFVDREDITEEPEAPRGWSTPCQAACTAALICLKRTAFKKIYIAVPTSVADDWFISIQS